MRLLLWVVASVALLPLVGCLGVRAIRRPVSSEAWWVAGACAVSFVADVVMWWLVQRQHHPVNGWVGYVAYPLQFSLLVCAVTTDRSSRWIAITAIAIMTVASSALPLGLWVSQGLVHLPPETLVRLVGGFLVGLLLSAPETAVEVRCRRPVLLYALGCLPFILGMGMLPRPSTEWWGAYGGYQVTRLVALGWATLLIVRPTVRALVSVEASTHVVSPATTVWLPPALVSPEGSRE